MKMKVFPWCEKEVIRDWCGVWVCGYVGMWVCGLGWQGLAGCGRVW
jgi:hypothetical protein